MNDKKDLDLLVEIAKLLKKYGPETFESLASNLSSPDFSGYLIDILSKSARTAKSVKINQGASSKKRKTQRDFRESLVELGKSEPDKSKLLLDFYERLVEKAVFSTLRDIQTFLTDQGFQAPKAKARDKAIIPFMKVLMSLSLGKLKDCLDEINSLTARNDRSLRGWSDIILDKERRQKDP